MSSKKKQSQRTKGNVRPSSSGRAADLLARDGVAGAGPSGFIGFGALSGDLGYVPAAQSPSLESDQDASLEPAFRMALRKLTKRDVITKLKAIQEFGALCKEKDADSVKGALPHWPRIYNRLATDHDKRVREATQQAFEQLILRVGRSLAPQLRALMGAWLLAQSDTYAPAALSARAAFRAAFPAQAKQGEALAYCKTVILRFLEDNLFKETAASLSDPRSYTPEEQEEKYLRVLTSSLLVLGEFVSMLPTAELPSVLDGLSGILAEGKLWKLAKHKTTQLRSAMYSLQGTLIKRAPSLAESQLSRMAGTLLGSLDESDPLAVQSLWDSVLVLVSTFPACWTQLNVRKAVLPKLWSMLRRGGHGSATIIHPNLLPFLSHIPKDVLGSGVGFYQEFFGNLQKGLMCSSAQQSTSEYTAIIKAYMECIRYAVAQSITSEASEERQIIQNHLIQDQLMPVLSQSVMEAGNLLGRRTLYHQTAQLVAHLRKQSPQACRRALATFWSGLGQLCLEHVRLPIAKDEDEGEGEGSSSAGSCLPRVSLMLSQLQSPDKLQGARLRAMKKRSVSFSDDKGEDGEETGPTAASPPPSAAKAAASAAAAAQELPAELLCLVRSLVRRSLAPARGGSLPHLDFLVRVLDSFQRPAVFRELLTAGGDCGEDMELMEAEESNASDGEDDGFEGRPEGQDYHPQTKEERASSPSGASEDNRGIRMSHLKDSELPEAEDSEVVLRRCFEDILLPWVLSEEGDEVPEDGEREKKVTQPQVLALLVDLVECLYRCCGEKQRTWVLDQFCQQSSHSRLLYRLIKKILGGAGAASALVWLRSASFGERLLRLTDVLCRQALNVDSEAPPPSQSWDLINLGLSVVQGEEPMMDPRYAEQILGRFTATLQGSKVGLVGSEQLQVHRCVNFICDIASNFFGGVHGCLVMSSAEDLLLALFQLGCREARDFPDAVQQKVLSAWTKGVEALVRQNGGYLKEDGFLCQAASWIRACLHRGPHTTSSLASLAQPAVALMDAVTASLPPSADPELPGVADSLLALLLPTEANWGQSMDLPAQWMDSVFLSETLTFTALPDTAAKDPVTMPMTLVQSVFVANILRLTTAAVSPIVEERSPGVGEETTGPEKEEAVEGWVATAPLPWRYDLIAPALKRLMHALEWCKGTLGVPSHVVQIQTQNVAVAVPAYCLEVAMVISESLEAMWSRLTAEDWEKLTSDLLEVSMETGHLWSLAVAHSLACFRQCNQGNQPALDVLRLAGGLDSFAVLNMPLIHTLEALVPHLSQSQRLDLLEINTAKLLTAGEDQLTQTDGGLGSLALVTAVGRQAEGLDAATQAHLMASCVQRLMGWREDCPEVFLFGSDFRDAVGSGEILLNVKMMQLMRLCVEKLPGSLDEQTWDFVLCSVTSWIQTCSQNVDVAHSLRLVAAFCSATFDLVASAATLLAGPGPALGLPANLATEWRELYSDSAFSLLLPAFVTIADSSQGESSLTVARRCLLQSAADAVRLMPVEQLLKHALSPAAATTAAAAAAASAPAPRGRGDSGAGPLEILLARLCPMLLGAGRPAQLAAYQLLSKVVAQVAKADEDRLKEDSSEDREKREEESSIPPPALLGELLDSSSAYMEAILAEVAVGECLRLDPGKDGCRTALSSVLTYLLAWRLYLGIFKAASAEVRARYANYLRQTNGVPNLMRNIFRLMPDPPVLSNASSPSSKTTAAGHVPRSMFSTPPSMTAKGVVANQEEIQHQACALYFSVLEDLPAMVRQWWTSQDKKLAAVVDRFTSKYASPLLCAQELRDVQSAAPASDHMTVKARPAAREVLATYTVQELAMDLTVRLPANHPLGIVAVDSERKVGVGTMQWRNWTLQLTTFLRNQNGSIMDGLQLWKRNVDKRFEGVDDCMICFSVIHGSNCSLPKLQCKTCKKRYHSACLYKWFSTSNQSTCPLCRSPF